MRRGTRIWFHFCRGYQPTLVHSILLTEQLSTTPAWTNNRAYTAVGGAGLTMPVFKRLSIAMSALHTLLNDPPAGFNKNSIQFTTGITYALK